jgi:hypothetical protein
MAPRRNVRRRRSDKRRLKKAKGVRALSKSAKADVAKLLRGHQAGTVTYVQLETGLKELRRQLDEMWIFVQFLW